MDIEMVGQELIKNLEIIKERYIKLEQEKEFSIRKDLVAIELKDIINRSDNYKNLIDNLNNYIKTLISSN